MKRLFCKNWEEDTLLMNHHGWKSIVSLNVNVADETTVSIELNLVSVVADFYDSALLHSPNNLSILKYHKLLQLPENHTETNDVEVTLLCCYTPFVCLICVHL